MYVISDFKRGLKILFNQNPYEIISYKHNKPGKGAAVVKTKMKNLINGFIIEYNFRSGSKFERPDLYEKDVKFLYCQDNLYYFLDVNNYNEIIIERKDLKNSVYFLVDSILISLCIFHGKVIDINVPKQVVMEVIKSDVVTDGNTINKVACRKRVVLSTGYSCYVPAFIKNKDKIIIDTKEGTYVNRVVI